MNWIAVLNEVLPALISVAVTVLIAALTWLGSRLGVGALITQWRLNEVLTRALQWAANQIPGVSLKDPVSAEQGQQLVELAEGYVKQNAPALAAKVSDTLTQKLEARIDLKKDAAL